jgi:hypothetical protein
VNTTDDDQPLGEAPDVTVVGEALEEARKLHAYQMAIARVDAALEQADELLASRKLRDEDDPD